MTNLARFWQSSTVGVFTLAAALIATPLPAVGGEPSSTTTHAASIGNSIRTVVATETLRTGQPPRAQERQAGSKTDLDSSSFFKTPAGIVTLVAIGAGVGYAIYSTNHDRVKSPAR